MIITVDRNMDRITINKVEMPCRYPEQTIDILIEIFDSLFNLVSLLSSDHKQVSIQLDEINEDRIKTIGEWR